MLFYAAGPLVPGNGGTDMVRANPLHAVAISCCVLPVAKDLVIETRGTALAASWFCGGRALAPA
jgi:hypothetical protein